MSNVKTTPGLTKLGLQQCTIHGQLFSNKPGAVCKKCAIAPAPVAEPTPVVEVQPEPTVAVSAKTCKKGHTYTTKRCPVCAKAYRNKEAK